MSGSLLFFTHLRHLGSSYIMNKKLPTKDNYFRIALLIGGGLLLIAIIFPIVVRLFAGSWAVSGTFGDTFGALNAIFSGITVVGLVLTILMQRTELSFQRQEMVQSRHEFSVNRITNIIYNQLERYEKALEKLSIVEGTTTISGYEAIFYLDSAKMDVTFGLFDETPEAERKSIIKKANCNAMTLYGANHQSIVQFALASYNTVKVVQETLLSSDIALDDINKLKNIFFRNIGSMQLGVLEDISKKYREHLDLSIEDGSTFLDECKADTGRLSRAYIYLRSVLEFRKIEVTDKYISEIKAEWTNHFGKYI